MAPELRPSALILGFGVHGLAIARSLGRRGIEVEAADPDAAQPHRHSRYCRRFHDVDSLDDEGLVEFLIGFGRRRRGRTALFVTMDRTVPLVSAHRDVLQEYFDFNLPPRTCIDELMDKARLLGFLERSGARHPRTASVRGPEALAAAEKSVGLPCVLKPALRAPGFKASIARSSAELAEQYLRAARHSDALVVQQWIPGGDSEVYFCFAYIGRNGQPQGLFVGRKLRQYPNGTGIAASAAGCDDEFVREETLRLFKLAEYRGFGSAEFRRDPSTGEYYLIEFTVGRTDYNVACAIANGVDLPYVGYCDLVGLCYEARAQKNDRIWVDLPRELKAMRQESGREPRKRWRAVAEIARCLDPRNVFTLFDPDDIKPFLAHAVDRVLAVPRALGRRVVARLCTAIQFGPPS